MKLISKPGCFKRNMLAGVLFQSTKKTDSYHMMYQKMLPVKTILIQLLPTMTAAERGILQHQHIYYTNTNSVL